MTDDLKDPEVRAKLRQQIADTGAPSAEVGTAPPPPPAPLKKNKWPLIIIPVMLVLLVVISKCAGPVG